ncbi:MAG: TIGR00730 family Rossman fold protein [Eudoraea sp.]|nr:TIGR00730 family Rossman fold protein [Eudoraea sp.]
MNSIVVFCGSSEGNDPIVLDKAYSLGREMAERSIRLVYGAARIGVMGKLAQGSLDYSGNVIGIIPDFLKHKEVFHDGLTKLIVTENMHERKLKMHEMSEAVIMLPGGYGTLEEFFEMITWAQLGLHQKPIGILNINGFYDNLMGMLKTMVDQGFVKKENYDMILIDHSINGLLDKMNYYKPQHVPKWINKDQL